MKPRSPANRMRDRVAIERPIPDDSFNGAGSGTWQAIDPEPTWCEIEDMLPSRGERLADGINVASRPARVRMRYRDGITPDMRFVAGDRVMQIVAGPARIRGGTMLEFVVEDYSTAGNPA